MKRSIKVPEKIEVIQRVKYRIYHLNDDVSDRIVLTPRNGRSYYYFDSEQKAINYLMKEVESEYTINDIVILPVRSFSRSAR